VRHAHHTPISTPILQLMRKLSAGRGLKDIMGEFSFDARYIHVQVDTISHVTVYLYMSLGFMQSLECVKKVS
jgi:hypothetical protein